MENLKKNMFYKKKQLDYKDCKGLKQFPGMSLGSVPATSCNKVTRRCGVASGTRRTGGGSETIMAGGPTFFISNVETVTIFINFFFFDLKL